MGKVRPRRMQVIRQLLASENVYPSEDEIQSAYRHSFDAYMAAWTSGGHFGAREQVLLFLDLFGVDQTTVDDEAVLQTALDIENAGLLADLELLPGARETVPALAAAGYRLGVISDTSLTPGRILRTFLEKDGLLDCLRGAHILRRDRLSQTRPKDVRKHSRGVGAGPAQAVHIGDTPRTDIAGAKALGMRTIRCAGSADHQEPPEADFVIRDHREIPAILEQWG